jgi:hypothetical protein
VGAPSYSLAATMKALRAIAKENQDKYIEARMAVLKASEAYRGFKIRCTTSAKVLLAFAVPALLFWLVVSLGKAAHSEASPSTIAIGALYVAISMMVSWKLGMKAAETEMPGSRQPGGGPRRRPLDSEN